MRTLSVLKYIVPFTILCSCSSTAPAPETTGSLSGLVFLYQPGSGNYAPYFDDASVQLEGMTYETVTDSAGFWSINGIPTGVYTLDVTKAGYGLFRWYAVPVFAGGANYVGPSYLPVLPPDSIVLDSVDTTTVGQNFYIKVSEHSTVPDLCAFFVDLSSDVNPEDSHVFASDAWGSSTTSHSGQINVQNLRREGVQSGTKLCISACAVAGLGSLGASYQDPHNANIRYTACGPKSNVLTFVMP